MKSSSNNITTPSAPASAPRKAGLAALLLLAWLAVGLGGCATFDKTLDFFGLGDPDQGPQTPEFLAMNGVEEMNRGNYKKALKIFQDIKDRYPFSAVGLLAELKAADAQFYLDNYREAHLLYQEFEANHPTNEAIPYVLFQMGLCHYLQIDSIDRDPGHAIDAIAAFSRLVQSFPGSPYEVEARARIQASRDFLARHEMYVATFYVKTGEYEQAEGRLDYLLTTYPDTAIVPKAGELLALLEAGTPPTRSWRDWLPDLSMPNWRGFIEAMTPSVFGSGTPSE